MRANPAGPASSIAASSILTEGYVGLENQALGLAEAAGLAPELCRVSPRAPWSRLPARWWPRPERAVDGLDGLGPGLIVSAGGTAAALSARLRRLEHRAVVHVQHPRMALDRFDLVVVNRHDGVTGPNVLVTRTALHRATRARLDRARHHWGPILEGWFDGTLDRRALVAVLLGGSNGRFALDAGTARSLAERLALSARRTGAAIAVTPSRRTAPEAIAAFREALAPLGGVVWDGTGDNPYFGLLACARTIVVTADSVSMVSEACATDAPVYVAPLPGRSRRIGRFLDLLRAERRIGIFEDAFDPFPAAPLDDTAEAAQEMRHRLGL